MPSWALLDPGLNGIRTCGNVFSFVVRIAAAPLQYVCLCDGFRMTAPPSSIWPVILERATRSSWRRSRARPTTSIPPSKLMSAGAGRELTGCRSRVAPRHGPSFCRLPSAMPHCVTAAIRRSATGTGRSSQRHSRLPAAAHRLLADYNEQTQAVHQHGRSRQNHRRCQFKRGHQALRSVH